MTQNCDKAAFKALPLGGIKPRGWLRDQLRIQADGFTGHLEEQWPDVGPDNGWIGGDGESWERGPYYVDGLLPLAYLLADERLIAKANRWVEWSLASQRADGNFGPARIETVNIDVNKKQDWWHYMIMLKVLTQHAEATGDARIVPFLGRFFRYLRGTIEAQPLDGWAKARGAELLLTILWLRERTEEAWLDELAAVVAGQTIDWTALLRDFPYRRKVEQWDWRTHVVNVAMGVKHPGVLHRLGLIADGAAAALRGIDSLMLYHGQAHGMFSGDEWLAGTHPSEGVELCAVVEYMFALEQLTLAFGDGRFGDVLEQVAFNALPAAIGADWRSHQYDQQVNQVVCNVAPRPWSNGPDANVFGLEPSFGCCTANMHQGWPKLAAHLWMADGAGGLAAVSYAPCEVSARVGDGAAATLRVGGGYPFRDTVTIAVGLARPARFALALRVPRWCEAPALTVGGEPVALAVGADGYARVEREWRDGDALTLRLPMAARFVHRGQRAVSVERGPLVYALPIRESWIPLRERAMFHDWELYPASPWKYGLLADTTFEAVETAAGGGAGGSAAGEGADRAGSADEPVGRGETAGAAAREDGLPYQPFAAADSPVRLKVRGKLIAEWPMEHGSAGTPPFWTPDGGRSWDDRPVAELELVPYGGAKLRIGEFPLIG